MARGIELVGVARQFSSTDFDNFDYIIAMDQANRRDLDRIAPNANARAKIHLLRDFDPNSPAGSDVPDPYYGGPESFERVLDLCEFACRHLLSHVRKTHGF